jgi:ABC-2 type transport system ATP-binding protein
MSSSGDELLTGRAEAALDIKNLRVVRGKRVALHDFSVTIPAGSITGLLGPSGCGKTTLMRSIVGTRLWNRELSPFSATRPAPPRCATGSAT